MQPVGILGGTFDPIHTGHIKLALEACQQLDLQQVRLIPVNIPPHRDLPVASTIDRLAMIELAIADEDQLVADRRELEKQETSYTINTLKSLREDLSDTPLCLIMGRDAFNQIDSWHQWQSLLDYAHIIVASRPGEQSSVSTAVQNWSDKHRSDNAEDIQHKPCGRIYFIAIPPMDISSTVIRANLKKNCGFTSGLHKTTLDYIKQHKLYQDVA